MKIVILTGATGYIGQYAIRFLLEKNYVVHAVSTREKPKSDNVFWHKADLLNSSEIENLIRKIRPTHLLHFAWYVEHGKFWNAPENLDWLRASLFLARKFAENGGERFVAAGTCAEYDWTAKSAFVENETPMKPQTLYGASKYALDLTLTKFAETTSVNFASGKIFFPFGGNESPNRLIPSVIRSLLTDQTAKTSHGRQIRDFIFVENAAEAFVELLDGDVSGAVNIGSGKGVELKTVIEEIGRITGKSELLQIGALNSAPNDPPEIIADTKRLKTEVGYEKTFDLKSKLEETIDFQKKHL